jgi:hypothetical protein
MVIGCKVVYFEKKNRLITAITKPTTIQLWNPPAGFLGILGCKPERFAFLKLFPCFAILYFIVGH